MWEGAGRVFRTAQSTRSCLNCHFCTRPNPCWGKWLSFLIVSPSMYLGQVSQRSDALRAIQRERRKWKTLPLLAPWISISARRNRPLSHLQRSGPILSPCTPAQAPHTAAKLASQQVVVPGSFHPRLRLARVTKTEPCPGDCSQALVSLNVSSCFTW